MIDVTMLGCAGSVPLPDRALSSALLTLEGRSILFDCGEGTQISARRLGVNLMRTDVIALTHYHGDHTFGIPGLLQSLSLGERKAPLYIVGPARPGNTAADELAEILTLTGKTEFDIVPVDMKPDGLRMCELVPGWPELAKLSAFRTDHRVPSFGYSFTLGRRGRFYPEKAEKIGVPKTMWHTLQNGEPVTFENERGESVKVDPSEVTGRERKGIKVSFSGDTRLCRELCSGAKGSDLLVCEATYGEDAHEDTAFEYGHMTFRQAAKAAKLSGSARLWLTHFSQRIVDPEEYLTLAREVFPAAECACDGKTVTLEFE